MHTRYILLDHLTLLIIISFYSIIQVDTDMIFFTQSLILLYILSSTSVHFTVITCTYQTLQVKCCDSV